MFLCFQTVVETDSSTLRDREEGGGYKDLVAWILWIRHVAVQERESGRVWTAGSFLSSRLICSLNSQAPSRGTNLKREHHRLLLTCKEIEESSRETNLYVNI